MTSLPAWECPSRTTGSCSPGSRLTVALAEESIGGLLVHELVADLNGVGPAGGRDRTVGRRTVELVGSLEHLAVRAQVPRHRGIDGDHVQNQRVADSAPLALV